MTKKITSIFIILTMLLSLFSLNTGATELYSDNTRLDALKGLGIVRGYESENKFFDIMSKSTFINFLLNMAYDEKYTAEYSEDALKTAEAMGIIDNSSSVSSTDTLKGEEAVKMAMCLLGYKELCLQTGGYPTGYTTKAMKIGLTKGINVSGNEMSNGDAYRLLHNALSVGIAEVDSFKTGGEADKHYYNEYEDVTVLMAYRNIYEIDGVVTANHTSDIYGGSVAKNGYVMIDEKIYKDSDGILYDKLGIMVKAYVQRTEGDEYNVIYAEPHYKCDIIEIDTDNIEKVSADIKSIEYYADDEASKTKKASIKASVSLLYNNVIYSDYTAEDFYAPDGKVVLIDNDGDDVIDVIKLNVYKNMIVSSVSPANLLINNEYTKYEGVMDKLDLSKYNSDGDRISFFLNGEKVSINDVLQGDVLSVFESINGNNKSIEVYITRDRAIINATGYNSSRKEVMAEDVIYEMSDTYSLANSKSENFAQTITPGRKYELYLDVNGKIVGARLAEDNELSYGYLRTAVPLSGTMDTEYALRIFCADGEWRNITLADKVKVNDRGRLSAQVTKTEADNNIGKIIGYELDNTGKIKHIEFPVLYSEDVNEERLTMTKDEEGRRWRYNNTSFDSYHFMTGDTVVFVIPSEELDNEDLYDIGNNYSFTSDEQITSYTGYGVDEFGFLDIALVRRDKSTSKKVGYSLYFVREIGAAMDSDGIVTPQLTVASSTYFGLSISAESDDIIKNINPGDIVRIHVNAKGYIDNVEQMYKIADKEVLDTPSDLHTYTTVKGKLIKADAVGERILLESSRRVALKVEKSVPVMIYDVKRDELKAGSTSDLTKDDYVIADISKSKVIGIYIYRNFEE